MSIKFKAIRNKHLNVNKKNLNIIAGDSIYYSLKLN